MNLKRALQGGVLALSILSLSGCVIVENLKLQLDGFDRYHSSASSLVYKMNNTPYYTSSVNYFVTVDRKGRYIRYLINMGSFFVGFPMITSENYDETIQKLIMFEQWANEPYEQRIKTLDQVQKNLSDNGSDTSVGNTDFYLFMSPDVNDNTPYFAYDRAVGYTTKAKFLISKDDIIVIINELKVWKNNSVNRK